MLKINEIDVYYRDQQAIWGVSLVVEKGKTVVLIGSNGAGKSTIIKAISGLVRPAAGSISFENNRIDKEPVHRIVELGISMVPEGRRLFSQMSVLGNLELGSFVHSARQVKNETLNWIYEIFPVLKNRIQQMAGTLSGGEQQMVAIARALMSKPKLLLLDELSLGLSPLVSQNIYKMVRQINESKRISILLVEQNVRMALKMADEGYVIENGRIMGEGKAETLLRNPAVKDAYFGLGQAWR